MAHARHYIGCAEDCSLRQPDQDKAVNSRTNGNSGFFAETLARCAEETIGDDSALFSDRRTIPICEKECEQRKCKCHCAPDCFAAEASRPVGDVQRVGSAQQLFGCLRIGQMIPPPSCDIYPYERNLRHPFWCAETGVCQFSYRLHDHARLPRQLNSDQDERAENQKADDEGKQHRRDRCLYTFADQPFANGPCCQGEHTSPRKRRQEAPQDQDRRDD